MYLEKEFIFGFCDCQLFSEDLKKLFNEIMSGNSESSKWNAFESFIKKYAWNYHNVFSMHNVVKPKNCSLKVCSVLLNRVALCFHRGIAKSLMAAVRLICVENFTFTSSSCIIEDLQASLSCLDSRKATGILVALHHHPNFFNSLLNFGFISDIKDDFPGFEREGYCMICSFIWMWLGRSCVHDAQKVMNLAKKTFFYYKNGEKFKRIFWATVAIRAIQLNLKNKNDFAKKFIYFLKAYFAATTDPFLTIFEVRSLLYACFTVLDKLDLFDIYCQEFEKLMPECPVEIEPRNLIDLARCQVRKNLNKCNLPLPSAVDQLCLPNALKSFVLGNITYIFRKRKNVSLQEAVTRSKLARLLSI